MTISERAASFIFDVNPGRIVFGAGLGAPLALRDLGLAAGDLDRAADLAVKNPYWNPRPVERETIRALLERAWAGVRPA
jgi:maleylacetate reductase